MEQLKYQPAIPHPQPSISKRTLNDPDTNISIISGHYATNLFVIKRCLNS